MREGGPSCLFQSGDLQWTSGRQRRGWGSLPGHAAAVRRPGLARRHHTSLAFAHRAQPYSQPQPSQSSMQENLSRQFTLASASIKRRSGLCGKPPPHALQACRPRHAMRGRQRALHIPTSFPSPNAAHALRLLAWVGRANQHPYHMQSHHAQCSPLACTKLTGATRPRPPPFLPPAQARHHQRVAGVGAALLVCREQALLVLQLQPAQGQQLVAVRQPRRRARQPVQRRRLLCMDNGQEELAKAFAGNTCNVCPPSRIVEHRMKHVRPATLRHMRPAARKPTAPPFEHQTSKGAPMQPSGSGARSKSRSSKWPCGTGGKWFCWPCIAALGSQTGCLAGCCVAQPALMLQPPQCWRMG